MKHRLHTSNPCWIPASHTNSYHPMTTAAMLPKKPSKLVKTTSSPYLVARLTNFHYTCGANSFLTWNGNSTSCGNPTLTPRSPHMRTSTAHTTTMHYPSFHLVWKPSSMTNPTNARLMPNTAPKDGSLARPQNTTGAGTYGRPPHAPLALPLQCSSNTNT